MAKEAPKTNAFGVTLDSFGVGKKDETKAEPVVETEDKAQMPDLFAGLKGSKPNGKNITFYLTETTIKKLKAQAKKQGVTASKLVEHILSEVLK